MTCRIVVGTICNYLEGTVSPRVGAALRKHFEGCKDCRLILEAAQRTLKSDFDRDNAFVTPPRATVA